MASASNNAILEHLEEGKSYELEFGDTWNSLQESNSSKTAYHTIKYDFKPASVLKSEEAQLTVGATQDVSITIPNVEGSSTQSTKFSGNTKPYAPKECLMIIDPRTGKIVIERLSANVRVKNVRMENRSVNPTVKTTVQRPNPTEPPQETKKTKSTTMKPVTTKSTNPSKSLVNAAVKPILSKRTSSPMGDRLSDDESSPVSLSNPPSASSLPTTTAANHLSRQTSHTTLAKDLELSDTSDEEN